MVVNDSEDEDLEREGRKRSDEVSFQDFDAFEGTENEGESSTYTTNRDGRTERDSENVVV